VNRNAARKTQGKSHRTGRGAGAWQEVGRDADANPAGMPDWRDAGMPGRKEGGDGKGRRMGGQGNLDDVEKLTRWECNIQYEERQVGELEHLGFKEWRDENGGWW
jgi:hypothetical protein